MNSKDYITNKSFCPLPWTGFIVEPDGKIKNCILSSHPIGDLKTNTLNNILHGDKNCEIKTAMLSKQNHTSCGGCYALEKNKKSFEIISSRVYYLRELKQVSLDTYSSVDNFDLKHIDARWSNLCNFACVYCDSTYSSKWAQELKQPIEKPSKERLDELKEYVYNNIENLTNVYLAGGEPLLMKENEKFLELLLEKNPNITIRVNTNLSRTQTRVFELLTKFKNVHWTISVETLEKEFEFVRYGGVWSDFLENLQTISKLNHIISFNMLWFLLNYKSLFSTVDYLKRLGFHNNTFIIGPLHSPKHLNIKNLPQTIIDELKIILSDRIGEKPGYFLEDGYKNLLNYLDTPFEKNLAYSKQQLQILDERRNKNLINTFPELCAILNQEGTHYG